MTEPTFFDSFSDLEKRYLWDLLATGLYGETLEDVMRELIRGGLRRAAEKKLVSLNRE